MAPPVLRQSAAQAVCRFHKRTAVATFSKPTIDKNLVVVTVVAAGGSTCRLDLDVPGFETIRERNIGLLQVGMYYREACPSLSKIAVTASADRSLQIRVMEYSGAAQSNALDRVAVLSSSQDVVDTSATGPITQADEVCVAVVANRHATTTQQGFVGGLVRLFETTSPQFYGLYGSNADADRTRMTVHELLVNTLGSIFRLLCKLSSYRDWIAIIATFRGGSSGPKRMTSAGPDIPSMVRAGTGGLGAQLSSFGKLASTKAPPITRAGTSERAVILPFIYQARLNGLLIGPNTVYDWISHEGLYGYSMRTSDDPQPRGDGALRGIDLQSERTVLMKVDVGGTEFEVEAYLDVLYRTLTPQRAVDWEMVWRHPGQAARLIRCRPVELPREVDDTRTRLADQPIQLKAVDPRQYSATPRQVVVPVTPAGSAPVITVAENDGNAPAFPTITVTVPATAAQVDRIELINLSVAGDAAATFDVRLTMPPRSVLVGDMDARVTGAPRSSITLDGATKYGAWQMPRVPFRIDAEPFVVGGLNELVLRTEPEGIPVRCVLDYRDVWAG